MSDVRTLSGRSVILGLAIRDAGNVLREVGGAFIRDAGGVLRAFFSALQASLDQAEIYGYTLSYAPIPVTVGPVSASPIGGSGPYSYAWSQVGGSDWTITTPTGASTTFTSPAVAATATLQAYFRCLVTDATGGQAYTGNVLASATNLGGIDVPVFV